MRGLMPKNIKILMKDGTERDFKYLNRGGSYSPSIRYETSFVVISDEWGSTTAIPVTDIKEVKTEELGGRF
jgi:hypothetical protein